MSKKFVQVLLVFVMLSVLAALPLVAGYAKGAPPKVFELKLATFIPPGNIQGFMNGEWSKEVEERTGGRVKVEVFYAGTLVPAPKIYSGVIAGIADIGFSGFAYTPGRFPAMEAVDIALGYEDGWVATRVINDFYANIKPKELDDVQVMYLNAHGPDVLYTVAKPVYTLEDIAGLKIRSTATVAPLWEGLGASTVLVPMGAVYETLSKAIADAFVACPEPLKAFKLGEVLKYCTNCYQVGATFGFFLVMNKDTWAKLPSDIQETITEINEEFIDKHGNAWVEREAEAQKYFLGFPGREVIELSPAEADRWVEVAEEKLHGDYLDRMAEKGLPGIEWLAVAKCLRNYYNEKVE